MPGTSSNGVTHRGYSPGKIGPITPLACQFVQVYVQPGFLLWVQAGWLCPDGHGIGEVQRLVVLRVPDLPDVHLDGRKLILPR